MKKVIVCIALALSFNASAFSLSELKQKTAVASETVKVLTQEETQAQRIDRQMAEADAKDKAAKDKADKDAQGKEKVTLW